jgi:hypothetical protein
MTYSTILYLKLIGIYIYIRVYSLISYVAEDRNTNRRMMYMEIVSVTFENAQKHINVLRGQTNVFFLVLKLAACTPTVRVVNDNYFKLKLSCLNKRLHGP